MHIRTVTTNRNAALALWEQHQDERLITNESCFILGRDLAVCLQRWHGYRDATPKAPESPTAPSVLRDVPDGETIEQRFTAALWGKKRTS